MAHEREYAEVDEDLDWTSRGPVSPWSVYRVSEEPDLQINGARRRYDGRFAPRDTPPAYVQSDSTPEKMQRCARKVEVALKPVIRGQPWESLRAIHRLRRRIDELEREAVLYARECGWSWQIIALGMSLPRQTVHRRHSGR